MNLPSSLSRNAVKAHFTKVSAGRWEYYFRHEKRNGIGSLRVDDGAFERAYYDTEKLKEWLIREAIYRTSDFEASELPVWVSVRQHAAA